MKLLSALIVATAISVVAAPAFAQSPSGGTGDVAGYGPGGSGAGELSAGPSKAFLQARHHRRHRRARRY